MGTLCTSRRLRTVPATAVRRIGRRGTRLHEASGRLKAKLEVEERLASAALAAGQRSPERAHVDGPECSGAQPHECLRAVAALGKAADSGGVLPNPTRLVLAGHALVALMVAALSDAGRLDEVSAADLLERTRRALVTGNPDDDQGLAILARADELTNYSLDRVHTAYQEAGAKWLQIGVPSLLAAVATPPPWVPRYVDLVEKLRANPGLSVEVDDRVR